MEPLLPDIARATVAAHEMLPAGAPVLAMVSGGADSTALLRLLASGALGEVRLSVLHVDHMLRGEESEADADFVAGTCADLGVECRVVRYDVSAYAAAEGLNLEDAGRRVRYRLADDELDAFCDATGAEAALGRVAVAHTFDDRMETFLMRLATGAGATGLSSIPYVRGRVVRPLLDARRADVTGYLRSLGQTWREDATNADTSRLRARVRAEVLPLLESVNPRFDEAIARTITLIGDEDELLDEMGEAFAGDFATKAEGALRIDRGRMLTLTRAMRRRTLRSALFSAFPEATRLEFSHLEALVDALGQDGFARDLPGGLRARCEYDTLVICLAGGETAPLAPSLLDVPGTVDLGEAGRLTARVARPDEVTDDPMKVVADAGRLRGPLTVGSAEPGDRMRPLGMKGTRKLQDVLTDAKVPRAARPLTPVVRNGGEIVWVAGVRLAEDYRVHDGTRNAVELSWTGPRRF